MNNVERRSIRRWSRSKSAGRINTYLLRLGSGDYDFATLWIGRHYPSSCFSWGEKSFKEKVCKQQLCHWFQNATQTCQEIMNQLSIHSLFQMCQMEKDRQQHQQRFLFFTFQFPPCIVDCRKAYYVEQVAIKQMVWAQLKALYVLCILLLLFFHIHMHMYQQPFLSMPGLYIIEERSNGARKKTCLLYQLPCLENKAFDIYICVQYSQ